MNLTPEFIDEVRSIANAYDKATDATERAELGAKLTNLADILSEGQLRQVSKILMR